MRAISRGAVAVFVCITGIAVVAQQPPPAAQSQPQTTFRRGVNFVRVDMYASRDGVPVADLAVEDIELREDGVLQKIDAFEFVRVPPGGPESARIEPSSIRGSRQMAADPRARVFVIFLDIYHLGRFELFREPLVRFLDQALGPDDLVGLMFPKMAVTDLQLGRKTGIIAELLNAGPRPRWLLDEKDLDEDEQLYLACFPPRDPVYSGWASAMIARRREKLTLDTLRELTSYLGDLRDERKALLVATEGWTLYHERQTPPTEFTQPPPPVPTGLPISRGGASETREAALMQRCNNDRRELFALDHRERLREITGLANRGNVTFYPISAGLETSTSAPRQATARTFVENRTPLERQSDLRALADDTDGIAIVNTNNIAEPMRRIIADTSSYYLVGYQSTNEKVDGAFRSIKVAVKRPGVTVRARRGYRAVSAAEMRAGAKAVTPAAGASAAPDATITRALNAVAAAGSSVPLRIRASAWTRPSAGGGDGALWIVAETAAGGRAASAGAPASAEVWVLGSGGQVRRNAPLEGGRVAIRVPDTGVIAPGEYDLRVTVRSAGGEPISDSVKVVVPSPAMLGEPLLLRGATASGARFSETADLKFRRTERMRLELPTASAVAATARVVDRRGETLAVTPQVSTRSDASGPFQWVVIDLGIAPLAPGDYVLAVTQERATQAVGFRVLP